jgi:GntR family transcriptional regulator
VFIKIDFSLSQPIFEQVASQIKFAIAAGTVQANEMIPSVRELSRQLTINPNTVARAYRLLHDEGFLSVRRGMGLAVAEGAEEICKKERKAFFEKKFQSFLDEAERSRVSIEELDEIISSYKQ